MGIKRCLSIIFIVFFNLFCISNSFASKDINAQIFQLIKKKQWVAAHSKAKKRGDKAMMNIILSEKYSDSSCPSNSFEKSIKFIENNPDWPKTNIIQLKAEKLLNDSTNKRKIYDFFKNHEPKTAKGHKYFVKSAFIYQKNTEQLKSVIKQAWQGGAYSGSEKQYYPKLKRYLSLKDHIKRIDNMLMDGKVTAAKKNLRLVPAGYAKSFNVQIALINSDKKGMQKFRKLDKKYYTSGLLYRYLSKIKKSQPSSAYAQQILSHAKLKGNYADKFTKTQLYLAREYMDQNRYKDAYKVISNNFAGDAVSVSNAEFTSGWLALTYNNKPELALQHFKKFTKVVKTPMSLARGIYWRARAYEAMKEREKARNLFELGAQKYPYIFYGQMCAAELGHSKLNLPKYSVPQHMPNNSLVKAAIYVSKYGSNGLAQLYAKTAVKSAKSKDEAAYVVSKLSKYGKNIHHTAWAAKYALQKHLYMSDKAYPAPYKLGKLPIETALTYSIIRQESVFNQYARSSAEAMGLMQLLPSTARDTARKIGIKYNKANLTRSPDYNIKLGSNYLAQMIDEYNGSYIMAIAAYNAGPRNVNKWVKRFGDPRKLKNYRDVINWMELIPFYETRNYVQRVLENLQIYRSKLNPSKKFSLKKDLSR